MNSLDKQYQDLLHDILDNGVIKKDRTGTGTVSIFGRHIKHNMSEGFPLLTTKKLPLKTIVTELIWFLKGDTNIKYLVDNGCNIWNGDAYKVYERTYAHDLDEPLPLKDFVQKIKTDKNFANVWGSLGPIYGKQWRDWTVESGYRNQWFDQIKVLINNLKENPDSRRLMVSAWNVGELSEMTLPPCHYGFQVYTKELSYEERLGLWNDKFRLENEEQNNQFTSNNKIWDTGLDTYGIPTRSISLMWNQRSVDTFLGLPFNIASYGLLLEIIAKEVNMVPDELIGNLGDVHLYSNHIEQAKKQIGRDSFKLPKLKMNPIFLANLEHRSFDEAINGQIDFHLVNYQSHPNIKAPLSN